MESEHDKPVLETLCVNWWIFNENIQQTQYGFERELSSTKMFIPSAIAIVASTLFVVASGAFLSDGVGEFNFTKVDDEYDFE